MPRIPNYTDDAGVQLNLPLIDGVSSRLSNETARLGAQMAERRGNDWLRVSELANAIAIRQQALRNSAEVSNAIAVATIELDNARNAQLERKGLDATGRPATEDGAEVLSATDTYGQSAASIQEKIRNNLLNDVQKRKFDEWYRNRYTSDLDTVARHQTQQLNAAVENSSQTLLKSAEDSMYAAMTRGDFETAENTFNSNYDIFASVQRMKGQPEEYVQQEYNGKLFTTAKAAIDQCVKNGNSEAGGRIADYFGKYLTQQQKDELRGTIRPGIVKDTADKFVRDNLVKNKDGSINLAETLKLIEAEADSRGAKSTFDTSGMTERQQEVIPAIIKVANERGYDPALLLSHIMIEAGAGLDSELSMYNNFGGISTDTPTALKRPDIEGGYYEDYTEAGIEGGINAVCDVLDRYEGVKGAKTVKEWNDRLMNNPNAPGKYYAEFDPTTGERQQPARENTQQQLIEGFLNRIGKGKGKRDEEFEKQSRAALERLNQDNRIELQQRAKDMGEQFLKDVEAGGIKTMTDAYKWTENNCKTEAEKVSYLHKYKEMNGLLTAMDKEQEELALNAAYEDIAQGKITTKEELNNYPISQKAKDAIIKAYFDKAMSWAKLPGVDGLINDAAKQMSDSDHRGQAKFVLTEAVTNKIKEKQRNNPTYVPDQWEVASMIKEQSSNMQVKQKEGTYLLWQSTYETKYPKGALVALGDGAEPLDSERVRDVNGVVWRWDKTAQMFKVDI